MYHEVLVYLRSRRRTLLPLQDSNILRQFYNAKLFAIEASRLEACIHPSPQSVEIFLELIDLI